MKVLTLAFLSLVGLAACDPTGSCIETVQPSDEAVSTCIVNFSKSLCGPPRQFARGSGEVALANCRAKGFVRLPPLNGKTLTAAEIEAEAKDGKVITLFPAH